MSSRVYDAIIVGAGIVGAACADSLSREGLSVAIVDRDVVGGGATSAGMGHVVVMDDSEAQFALTRYSQQLWMELQPELPADVEYRQYGTLWIAADEEELAEVLRKQRYYASRDVPANAIDEGTLAQLEPNLRAGLAGALLVPQDSVLHAPSAARFLAERAQRAGTEVIPGCFVSQIEDGKVVLSDGRRLSARFIINAAGTWSPKLTPGLEIKLRKGHIVVTDRYPSFLQHELVELGYIKSAHSVTIDSVAFNVQPRRNGQMLIGSSRQFGVEDEDVNEAIVSRMLRRAIEYMPGLADTQAISTRTGFRAATPDNLPLIGPLPGHESIFLATGHEGLGITTSLGTASLITDQIMARPTSIPHEPYQPSRRSQ